MEPVYIAGKSFEKVDSNKNSMALGEYENCKFIDCDLAQAVIDNTMLDKADLRTSFNYSIDPERNRIKKAKFSIIGIAGLLDKYDIEIER